MTLLNLADAKADLRITSPKFDQLLTSFIDAATPVMEDLVGSLDESDVLVETYDGGGLQISLIHAPVISITTVIESYGSNYQHILTAQDLFTPGGSVDAYGYSIDLTSGVVTRRAAGVAISFAPGERNIQVTYLAGRSTIPANVKLAAMELVRFWWQDSQQGNRTAQYVPDPAEMEYTSAGYAVPRRVIQLCAGNLRIAGIA